MKFDPLTSLLVATVVLLAGTLINRRVRWLAHYNIPDPITGGLLFAVLASAAWAATDFQIAVDQTIKPELLLMFFAGTGLCADLRILKRGGKALAIFLALLFPFVILQNLVGVATAQALDLHPIFGLVGGSITLTGGHGTGAAYAERFAEVNNLQAVMELSMTSATLGLILGGIIAGPIAQYLINRYKLGPRATAKDKATGEGEQAVPMSTVGMIGALAAILAAVVAGHWLAEKFSGGAITIPSFLWCMILGVILRNLLPFIGLHLDDRATNIVAGVCLSIFLVMTMMALNLIEVALSAGPLLVVIAMQVLAIVVYSIYICFRYLGRDYEAAVTTSAFIGFSMGSTATAMVNMQAVTQKYGPAPQSYLIVPLAGAFFVDLMNAFVLTALLALPFVGG